MTARAQDAEDAAAFAAHMADLRAHEPAADEPDAIEIEVTDGVRTERVRARMAPGPWSMITGRVS